MPISDPATYVSKIAEKSGISGKTQGAAIAILKDTRQKRFSAGKDPMGMAAAVLYIACLQNNERITQRDLAEAAGVTEVTVRNRYKELARQLKLEVPQRVSFLALFALDRVNRHSIELRQLFVFGLNLF